ncbi:diadenylate cyclase, partial [Candidatus Hakubella thermalkaliphila]
EQRRPKELLSLSDLADILGYPTDVNLLEYSVSSRGYRILSKVPHLPVSAIENMVKHFQSFQKIFNADVEELVRVEGCGPGRAQSIKDSLRRLNELNMLDKYI